MFKPVWPKIYQCGFMGGLVGDAGCLLGNGDGLLFLCFAI